MASDATPGATGVVLILQPRGAAECEELSIIHDCLRQAGLRGVERAADSLSDADFSALVVRGAIPVRGYLNLDRSDTELLDPCVRETIRCFFHAAKPIAAPCMGLAVVVEALALLVRGQHLDGGRSQARPGTCGSATPGLERTPGRLVLL